MFWAEGGLIISTYFMEYMGAKGQYLGVMRRLGSTLRGCRDERGQGSG